MSLWDWLLAAWIYEELFDDDSDNTSHDNTRDYDSSYNYDDYEEDYWWFSTLCIEIMFNFVREKNFTPLLYGEKENDRTIHFPSAKSTW